VSEEKRSRFVKEKNIMQDTVIQNAGESLPHCPSFTDILMLLQRRRPMFSASRHPVRALR